MNKKQFLKEHFIIKIAGKTYPFMSRKRFFEMKKEGKIPKGIEPLPKRYAKKIEEMMNE